MGNRREIGGSSAGDRQEKSRRETGKNRHHNKPNAHNTPDLKTTSGRNKTQTDPHKAWLGLLVRAHMRSHAERTEVYWCSKSMQTRAELLTFICGLLPADSYLRTLTCGLLPADAYLRTLPCGRLPADSYLRTLTCGLLPAAQRQLQHAPR